MRKYIPTFKDFITKLNNNVNESYERDYNDDYDEDFKKYALDEIPLTWSTEEQEDVRSIYGGVDVGVVYHGGKLDSSDKLKYIQNIKKGKIKTFKCNLLSATPYYSEALSFAYYVKSYDTSLMLKMLISAYENGSAGKYGSFVIKLKPTPDQVILSTFNSPNKLTRSAETECLLSGEIEVIGVEIYDPFTKENYINQIKNMSYNDIVKNDFLKDWLRHHKLKFPIDIISEKLLEKSEEELLSILSKDKNTYYISYNDLKNDSKIQNIMDNTTMDDDGNLILSNGEKLAFFPRDRELYRFIFEKNKEKIMDKLTNIDNSNSIKIDFINDDYNLVKLSPEAQTFFILAHRFNIPIDGYKMYNKVKNVFNKIKNNFDKPIIDIISDLNKKISFLNLYERLIYMDKELAKEVYMKMYNKISNSTEVNDIESFEEKKNVIYQITKISKDILQLISAASK